MARYTEELSEETREMLNDLTEDDIRTIKAGLPIIRAIIGFGTVVKWLIIMVVGVTAGGVLFGESIMKIIEWMKPAP